MNLRRGHVAAVGIALASLVLGVSAGQSASAVHGPAEDGRIVLAKKFRGPDGKNFDIYSIAPDGSDRLQLTDSSAEERDPTISPDGGTIAFSSDQSGTFEIYLMPVGGGEADQITPSGPPEELLPEFSPDGSLIASTSRRGKDANSNIVTTAIDGGDRRRLTPLRGDELAPSYSPDGEQIAYTTIRRSSVEIALMDADGSSSRLLTRLSDEKFAGFPDFLPGGRTIAFEQFPYGIATIRQNGSRSELLRRCVCFDPKYSPNGEQIVYADYDPPQSGLRIMNADGSDASLVPNTSGRDQMPDWGVLP